MEYGGMSDERPTMTKPNRMQPRVRKGLTVWNKGKMKIIVTVYTTNLRLKTLLKGIMPPFYTVLCMVLA